MGGYWETLPGANSRSRSKHSNFRARLKNKLARAVPDRRKRGLAHREWKRDLSGRPKGTLDPWYACDLQDYLIDYAVNYTYPWAKSGGGVSGFDVSDDWQYLPTMASNKFVPVHSGTTFLRRYFQRLSKTRLSSSTVLPTQLLLDSR